MTRAQRGGLAAWAVLLCAFLCLLMLPVSRAVGVMLLLLCIVLIAAGLFIALRRRPLPEDIGSEVLAETLPEAHYRLPVVLCCNLCATDSTAVTVRRVTQGCEIQVARAGDLQHILRQVLQLRPDWGRQLAISVSVNPQQHQDVAALENQLLELRWQIALLRRECGQTLPLLLSSQVAGTCTQTTEPVWQLTTASAQTQVWVAGQAPCAVAQWLQAEGTVAFAQQVLFNTLDAWFNRHVLSVFTSDNADIKPVAPFAVLCALQPQLADTQAKSLWTDWLTAHSALQAVQGWQPAEHAAQSAARPDFIMPLLPAGQGVTPLTRTMRAGTSLFIATGVAALLCSAWNNQAFIHRVAFDLNRYAQIAMADYVAKFAAVETLQQDAEQLDTWARQGEPVGMGLGLYQGGRLHQPVLSAIASYQPPAIPPPLPEDKGQPQPTIVRLDSLSLFDSGRAELKSGSTKVLVNALVGIKAKPGWLIVVAGHSDNTGNATFNQRLSLRRAEAVRDWMRDTGDVPESCFAVQGFGQSRPLANNDTPQGRATNRRVEISLVPQADACRLPDATLPSSQDGDGIKNQME
ncbi:hypothetical protein CIG19_06645 [Enterobacterales bacterium CwR94]|nr:hypothetical protein CIG19_06645 [Enterobacterales bacterium CwR94]